MNWLIKILLSIIISFAVGMIFSPLFIKWSKKIKLNQTILHYVEKHKEKNGTPTMGGIIFILPSFLTPFIFYNAHNSLGMYASLIMLSYGVLGFLDDYIKVKLKQNLGLKAYQKIIGQVGIAIIASVYAYKNLSIGSSIYIPFMKNELDLKWFYIAFIIFVFIATTNSVNLTDGLDGLAAGTGFTSLLILLITLIIMIVGNNNTGNVFQGMELTSIAIYAASLIGGLIAFLWHNTNKASIFMGDTGALALGGGIAAIAVFSKNPLIIVFVGIMFIVSAVSDIIQVSYFKCTKGKRVFTMAPYHHHLQDKGFSESKISAFYMIITFIMGIIALIGCLWWY